MCYFEIDYIIDLGVLSLGSEAAKDKIETRHGSVISADGVGVADIEMMRSAVESLSDPRVANCMIATAPHTHWDSNIIVEAYRRSCDKYFVGPRACSGEYTPCSFVFTSDGVFPYEWIDSSVPVSKEEINEAIMHVYKIYDYILDKIDNINEYPLGISIDHRYKRSIWEGQLFSFSESASDVESGISEINANMGYLGHDLGDQDTVQVAWSLYPSSDITFSKHMVSSEKLISAVGHLIASRGPSYVISVLSHIERNFKLN